MQQVVYRQGDAWVGPVGIDDWTDIRHLQKEFSETRFQDYISGTLEELETFYVKSRAWPERVGFLQVRWQEHLCGLAALLLVDAPQLGKSDKPVDRQCFIHSVYIAPKIVVFPAYHGMVVGRTHRVPGYVGKVMCEGMVRWAKAPRPDGLGGATKLFGNVRLDGNFGGFARKFGFLKTHSVVVKEL